jgi:hypothetical protein
MTPLIIVYGGTTNMALFRSRRTELVPANRTEHEKGSVRCLKDIRMAVIAAAIFLDENANEKHRDRAHALLMEVAEQFGIDWN